MAKIKNLLTGLLCLGIFVSSAVFAKTSAQTVVSTSDIYGRAKSINNLGYVLVVEQIPSTDPNSMASTFKVGIWNSTDQSYATMSAVFTQDPINSTSSLNDSLVFVGTDYDSKTFTNSAFIYDQTVGYQPLVPALTVKLATSSAITDSRAFAINNNGQVVGTYTLNNDMKNHMYVYQNGIVTLIDDSSLTFNSITPMDINNNGVIAGFTDSEAFVYDMATQVFTIITDAGHSNIQPQSINDLGTVVGNSTNITQNNRQEGFVWNGKGSKFIGITALGGILDSMGGGLMTHTTANSINSSGYVVGISSASDGKDHAYVMDDKGQMTDLGLVDASASGSEALSINDSGYIVGWNSTNDLTLPPVYPVIWDYVVTKSNNGKRIQKGKKNMTLSVVVPTHKSNKK